MRPNICKDFFFFLSQKIRFPYYCKTRTYLVIFFFSNILHTCDSACMSGYSISSRKKKVSGITLKGLSSEGAEILNSFRILSIMVEIHSSGLVKSIVGTPRSGYFQKEKIATIPIFFKSPYR